MKLVRFSPLDAPASRYWGELAGDTIYARASGTGARTGQSFRAHDVSLLPPCEPKNIVCVGKNYAKHVVEMGGAADNLPQEPGLFLKPLSSLKPLDAPILYPSWTQDLQYEGELAVVIGKVMRQVSAADALDYVLGYTCAVDVTARDKQRSDLQWTRGKGADTFCAVGEVVETELDPANVRLQTYLNGELRQDGHTQDLIFSVPEVLAYISSFMTLQPGDLVLTGTPEGVGPMAVGDVLELRIEGVGRLSCTVAAG